MSVGTRAICEVVERAAMLVDMNKLCRREVSECSAVFISHKGRARLRSRHSVSEVKCTCRTCPERTSSFFTPDTRHPQTCGWN